LGAALPHTLGAGDVDRVLREMEAVGRAPNTVRTQWVMIRAFLAWLVSPGILPESPAASLSRRPAEGAPRRPGQAGTGRAAVHQPQG
jgi:hypothetical protein